ncbi:MAG: SOS response-associated peptidase [Thermoanaerobaculia bacterium]|nr:SOS response-associated peptidase [Thermoanaerobaculia bacterium]
MCGRYTLSNPGDLIAELGAAGNPDLIIPRYNIAPTQDVPAVCVDTQGQRKLAPFRWGLIPFWANDKSVGHRMINARAETVAEKPAYRNAFGSRRCLLLADGFYEWKRERSAEGKPVRQPFHIHLTGRAPFTMAGLWEFWNQDPANPTYSCTILTTQANETVTELHERMPVILQGSARDTWLDTDSSVDELLELLVPLPSEDVELHPVSRIVNRPQNDVAACMEPVA